MAFSVTERNLGVAVSWTESLKWLAPAASPKNSRREEAGESIQLDRSEG